MTAEEKKKQNPYTVDADALYSRLSGDKPTYAGTYDNQLTDLYNRITTRPAFEYDVTKDPMYQQYKGQYIQQGKLAMKDTMGQAAALTGGYGNSYGQQVGQQAYDAYLQKLGDVVPELYDRAYGRWSDENNRLLQQYAMLGDLRDTEYNRWRTDVGDWENERAYRTQLENEAYNRGWAEDERAYARERDALSDQRYADELAYARERDALSDQRYADELAYNRQWSEDARAYERERDALSDQRYADELAYNRLWAESERDYSRQRDAISDQRYADELAYSRLWNEADREYARQRDAISDQRYADELAYAREQTAGNTAYSRQQQAYSNLYALIGSTGYNPTDAELAAAGMTRKAADALRNEYARETTPATTGGGSSGGGGGRSGGGGSSSQSGAPDWWNAMSDAERKAYQSSVGTAADGIWGPNTRAASLAADGLNGPGGGGGATTDGLTFNSQREFDAWLKQQVSDGVIDMKDATDIRDEWSRFVVK